MNLVELTEHLITIPSYVDEVTDEHGVGEFVIDYLRSLGGPLRRKTARGR